MAYSSGMATRAQSPAATVRVAIAITLAGSSMLGSATIAQQGTPKQLLGMLRVTDKKDVPLTDVTAGELEVKENGQSRPVQSAELDTRPLAVALVLDNNSELSTSFMQSVVPAGVAAIKALPAGTIIDIWTTGDRPTHVGKDLSDPAAAEAALKGVAAIGTNSLLNTIADASKALPSDDGHRTAVIILTTGTLGDTGGYGYEQALKVTSMRPTFVSLEFVTGKPDARVENELEFLAKHSGGFFERVLAVTAFEKRVPFLVTILNAQYRVAWQPGMDPREATLDFKCSRKGTKVVAAQRLSAVW
jgi:hypothetical protein